MVSNKKYFSKIPHIKTSKGENYLRNAVICFTIQAGEKKKKHPDNALRTNHISVFFFKRDFKDFLPTL